ncbi:MAG TPA: hypothetical protein PKH07_04910, partial [bacterium]|nr:hypothetical protein [bacterium]
LQPDLLILDDPFAGLGTKFQNRLTEFLLSLEATVLVTSCLDEPLKAFCDTFVLLQSKGRVER